MKAILIDAYEKQVREVEFDPSKSWDDLRELCKLRLFTVAVHIDDKTDILVDDEGLFKEGNLPGFSYEGYPGHLVGSGVIVQHDEDGNSVSLDRISLDEVSSKVGWVVMPNSSKEKILKEGPKITGFTQDWDDIPLVPRSSILDRYKAFMANNPAESKADQTRLIFLNESLSDQSGHNSALVQGILRPGRKEINPTPDVTGILATRYVQHDNVIHSAQRDYRPFFLGEPFPIVWIESPNRPLLGILQSGFGNEQPIPIYAIWLWRSTADNYAAVLIGRNFSVATIISDEPNADTAAYMMSAVHSFLFHLFRKLAKEGQLGTERIHERFKVGSGHGKKVVKIKDIVHIRMKQKVSVSTISSEGRTIEWSHRWEVMGHWRRVQGIGKDDQGRYHIQGFTWVMPHTKGPEEKDLVKKTRVYLAGTEGDHEQG
jgi:hypothetical protein